MSAPEPEDQVEDVVGVVEPEGPTLPAVAPGAEVAALRAPSPAVQAAAVAATGLMAGAATVAAVRHVRTHGLASGRRARRWRKHAPVVATRSFLVDVHLLDPRG